MTQRKPYVNRLFSCQRVPIFEEKPAARIFSGYNSNMVVAGGNEDDLWVFGADDKDQLGTGSAQTFRSKPHRCRLSKAHTRYIDSSGEGTSRMVSRKESIEIYVAGDDGSVRPISTTIEEVALGAEHSLVLTNWGQVFFTGSRHKLRLSTSQPCPTAGLRLLEFTSRRRVISVAAGRSHSLLLLDTNEVLACGDNSHGQLGSSVSLGNESGGTLRNFVSVVALRNKSVCKVFAGEYSSFALTISQDVFAWGRGRGSKGGDPLGLDTSGRNVPKHLMKESKNGKDESIVSASPLPGSIAWDRANRARAERDRARLGEQAARKQQISAHVAAGTVYLPKRIKSLEKEFVVSIAAGDRHTLFLSETHRRGRETGRVRAERTSRRGASSRSVLTRSSMMSADASLPTYALFATGDAECGQIGLGTFMSRRTPGRVIGAPEDTIRISCGSRHSALVTSEGHLYAFGNAENGRLGFSRSDESTEKIPRQSTPRKVTAIADSIFESDRRNGWLLLQKQQRFDAPLLMEARLEEAHYNLHDDKRAHLWRRALERRFFCVAITRKSCPGRRLGGWTGALGRVQRLMRKIRRRLRSSWKENTYFALQRLYQGFLDPFDEQHVRSELLRVGVVEKLGFKSFSRRDAKRLCREFGHKREVTTQLMPVNALSEKEFLNGMYDLLRRRRFSEKRGYVGGWGSICYHGLIRRDCNMCNMAPSAEVRGTQKCERAFVDADGLSATAALLRQEASLLRMENIRLGGGNKRRFAFTSAAAFARYAERKSSRDDELDDMIRGKCGGGVTGWWRRRRYRQQVAARENRTKMWSAAVGRRSREMPSVPPYLVRMFETSLRSSKLRPTPFLCATLVERWFGVDGTLRCGELRLVKEDVAEAGANVRGLISLVEIVIRLIRTIPIVALLDIRALPIPLPYRILRDIHHLLVYQENSIEPNLGRCNKCSKAVPMRLWSAPVQPCELRACRGGGIVVRSYHRLAELRLPQNQRIASAVEIARADLVARFAASVAPHFPAAERGSKKSKSKKKQRNRRAIDTIIKCGKKRQKSVKRERHRGRRKLDTVLEDGEEVDAEREEEEDSEEEEDNDESLPEAASSARAMGALPRAQFDRLFLNEMRRSARLYGLALEPDTRRMWPDATEKETALDEIDAEYLIDPESDYDDDNNDDDDDDDLHEVATDASSEEDEDFELLDPLTCKSNKFRPKTWYRPPTAPMSDAAKPLREAVRQRYEREIQETKDAGEKRRKDIKRHLRDDNDDYTSSYAGTASNLDDETESWSSRLNSADRRRLLMSRDAVSGDGTFRLRSIASQLMRMTYLRGTCAPPREWMTRCATPGTVGSRSLTEKRGRLHRPTTRDLHYAAVQRSAEEATGRPRSKSRPWRGKSGEDFNVRIFSSVERVSKVLLPKWPAKRRHTMCATARDAVDRLRRVAMRRAGASEDDVREDNACLEPIVSLLACLRQEFRTQHRRNQYAWQQRQSGFRSLLASLASASEDTVRAEIEEGDADIVERQRQTEWRAWNRWSSACKKSLKELENLVEELRFSLIFGRQCLGTIIQDFHRGGTAYYASMFFKQFSRYVATTQKRTIQKAHALFHQKRRDKTTTAVTTRSVLRSVRRVFEDAERRAADRLDAWCAEADVRSVVIDRFRHLAIVCKEHFVKLHALARVRDVQCGHSHSLVLTRSGEVWSLGMFHVSCGVAGSSGLGVNRQLSARIASSMRWMHKRQNQNAQDHRLESAATFEGDDGRSVHAGRSVDAEKKDSEDAYFAGFDRDAPIRASLLNMILQLDLPTLQRWFVARPTRLRHALWRLCRRHMCYGDHADPSWAQDANEALELVRSKLKSIMAK